MSELLIVLSATVFSGFIILMVLHRRSQLKHQNSTSKLMDQISHLKNDFYATCEANRKMGEHILSLEKKIHAVTQRQDNLDMREPNLATYKQAINMAHDGANIKDLMNTCGLGRTEAELVHLMHKQTAEMKPEQFRNVS